MTPARRRAVLSQSGGICGACLNPLDGPVEIDHIIPLELGGDECLNNLQALHPACHREKTKRDIKAIAKMRRLQAKARKKPPDATQQPKRQIRSRGFDKTVRKLFDGRVVRREP
jgi:5-methylcytosine-specific restriction endonuclease McrA